METPSPHGLGDHPLPGRLLRREEVPRPAGYVIVDFETTHREPVSAAIVQVALIQYDADGVELDHFWALVDPECEIPAEVTAIHGIDAAKVQGAPCFVEVADEILRRLEKSVFAGHNAAFDLEVLQVSLARIGRDYQPPAIACTWKLRQLLDPFAPDHKLETCCERMEIVLDGNYHDAGADAYRAGAILCWGLGEGWAPETAWVDDQAFLRLKSLHDERPASAGQIRRVFGLARSAGLVDGQGKVDREAVLDVVERTVGTRNVDSLTRAQIQRVYDVLEG